MNALLQLICNVSRLAKEFPDDSPEREMLYEAKNLLLAGLRTAYGNEVTCRYQLSTQGFVTLLLEAHAGEPFSAHIPFAVAPQSLREAALHDTHETPVEFRHRVLRQERERRRDGWQTDSNPRSPK